MTKKITLREWLDKEPMTAYALAKKVKATPQRINATLKGSEPRGEYRKRLLEVTRGEVEFFAG